MEIRSRFEIVVSLVHDRHSLICFETVTSCLISVVKFSLLERITDINELLWRLIQGLLDLFVQLLLLNKLVTGLYEGWSGLICQIEEIDVRFHEAFRQQPDTHGHLVLLLLQLETPILFHFVHCTSRVVRLLLHLLASGTVLLKYLSLRSGNEFIFFLSLGLSDDLAYAGVRVNDWL